MFTRFLPPEEGDSFHVCSEAYLLLSLRNSLAPSVSHVRTAGRPPESRCVVAWRWRSYRYSATVAERAVDGEISADPVNESLYATFLVAHKMKEIDV